MKEDLEVLESLNQRQMKAKQRVAKTEDKAGRPIAERRREGMKPNHEMECTTEVLMNIIATKASTRNIVALAYAHALRSYDNTDYRQVNEAILARWSLNALNYIKTRAWKIVETKGMMMEIKCKDLSVHIQDVVFGDCFLHESNWHMRVRYDNPGSEDLYAVTCNGTLLKLRKGTVVTIMSGSFIEE